MKCYNYSDFAGTLSNEQREQNESDRDCSDSCNCSSHSCNYCSCFPNGSAQYTTDIPTPASGSLIPFVNKQIQCGRSITLNKEGTTVTLAPCKTYQICYNIRASVALGKYLEIIPVIDDVATPLYAVRVHRSLTDGVVNASTCFLLQTDKKSTKLQLKYNSAIFLQDPQASTADIDTEDAPHTESDTVNTELSTDGLRLTGYILIIEVN